MDQQKGIFGGLSKAGFAHNLLMGQHSSQTLIHIHRLTLQSSSVTSGRYAVCAFKLKPNYGDSNSAVATDGYLCAAEFQKGKWFALYQLQASSHFSWPSFHGQKSGAEGGRINSIHLNLSTLHPQKPGSESSLLCRAVRKPGEATHWAMQNIRPGSGPSPT